MLSPVANITVNLVKDGSKDIDEIQKINSIKAIY